MRDLLPSERPLLLLAPMQDVTDRAFFEVIHTYGGADVYVTEYFRVHRESKPEKQILDSVLHHGTGRPVIAQMIGEDIAALVRTAKELQRYPVAGIDLNLGCPAPIVCRKQAGGGLLRTPEKLAAILHALRDTVGNRFTVKTRVGYDSPAEFDRLLEVFAACPIDALTIHGRTVKDRYRTPLHLHAIARAVECLPCPVIANGNVVSVRAGLSLRAQTGAAGLMIGRGAIRNPLLFHGLRTAWSHGPEAGEHAARFSLRQVLEYVERLFEKTKTPRLDRFDASKHVQKLKKYLAFIAQGVDREGRFEYEIRRVSTGEAFWDTCRRHLDRDGFLAPDPPSGSRVFCGFDQLLR